MKKYLLIMLTTLCLIGNLSAEQAKDKPPFDEATMKVMKEATTPGKEHELLQKFVGNWTYTSNFWMTPDSEAEVSNGTNKVEAILGGRHIKQQIKGTSMGEPFEGISLIGFDNIKKEYQTYWIDSMSTAAATGTATYDPDKKVIAEEGSSSCPMTPSKTRNFRGKLYLPENDSFKYEMYSADESGKDYKMIEIVYTKVK